jgi:hypothetical protein
LGEPENEQILPSVRFAVKREGFPRRFSVRVDWVLKNKHQAVSQGVRRFGKRSIFGNM